MRWQVRARAPDWLQQSSREKDAPSAISTGVKKLWKANSVYRLSFFRTSGYCRTGLRLPLFAPCVASKYSALAPPLSDSAGLSPIEAQGASEKCAKDSSGFHISCTVFPQGRLFGTLPATR